VSYYPKIVMQAATIPVHVFVSLRLRTPVLEKFFNKDFERGDALWTARALDPILLLSSQ
jgi:hypothetical protein